MVVPNPIAKIQKISVSHEEYSENQRKHYVILQLMYLQPIITQYFIDNKSEIWLLFLIAHSKR